MDISSRAKSILKRANDESLRKVAEGSDNIDARRHAEEELVRRQEARKKGEKDKDA